jgi:biotin carboxyl carrier protein
MEVAGNNGSQDKEPQVRADVSVGRRRTPWPLVVVALLLVVGPFLAWYWTWFGRSLGDDEIEKYLREGKPRHMQHALAEIEGRIEKGDKGAGRWFPQIVALSQNGVTDVRMTAAWVMGVEHRSEEFHSALLRLLDDPEPIVRRNAALALVRFGDPRSRAELATMLRPYAVKAGADGVALTALTEGTPVKRESLLVKFRNASGAVEEVRSPLPGVIEKAHVKDGQSITRGSDIFILAPDAEQAGDALVGLYYFGGAEDLPDVERYAGGVSGMPTDVKAKAAQTAEAIKRRIAKER